MRAAYRTTRPAAVAGPPARQRCHSPRALGLRVVPLRPGFDPYAEDTRAARRLRATLADAYAYGGRLGLAVALRAEVAAAVRNRAANAEERAVLRAWLRYTYADMLPAWLATAYAEGWPHPGA